MRKFVVIISIIFFICGYCFSFWFQFETVSDKEFELYEQAAWNYYNQQLKKAELYEIPKGVSIEKNDDCTNIIVSSSEGKLGKVIAKLQDGKLVYERDPQLEEIKIYNIFLGIIFGAVAVVLWRILLGVFIVCCQKIFEKIFDA